MLRLFAVLTVLAALPAASASAAGFAPPVVVSAKRADVQGPAVGIAANGRAAVAFRQTGTPLLVRTGRHPWALGRLLKVPRSDAASLWRVVVATTGATTVCWDA